MKIRLQWLAVFTAMTAQLHAAAFAPGNLVVYRVGTGGAALNNSSTEVFLDEYTPSGTLVQSIALPTSNAGSQYALTASGTATSEGLLTLSVDGQYILLTGYGTNTGIASIAGTTSTAVPRVVGRVDLSGNIDTSTALTDWVSGNNPRSATSTDGTNIWLAGAGGGIRFTTAGSTASTLIAGTGGTGATNNNRQVNIFDQQLYFSAQSGSLRLGTVGPGLPTTGGQIVTNLPGFPITGSPYAFVALDLSLSVAGVDTLYVADDGSSTQGIFKYSLVGGNWTSNGFVSVVGQVRGLTAALDGSGNVDLFSTSITNIYAFVDSTGYNGALSGSANIIATAAANEAFRGIVMVPEPSTLALVFAGVGALVVFRRRR